VRASTKKLVAELEKAGAPERMKVKAIDGHYNDIDSPSPTPITDLVCDAEAAGLTDLANAARNGAFDAGRDEWRPR
jgi:hypothetical protein